jgi:hypothetical protein
MLLSFNRLGLAHYYADMRIAQNFVYHFVLFLSFLELLTKFLRRDWNCWLSFLRWVFLIYMTFIEHLSILFIWNFFFLNNNFLIRSISFTFFWISQKYLIGLWRLQIWFILTCLAFYLLLTTRQAIINFVFYMMILIWWDLFGIILQAVLR